MLVRRNCNVQTSCWLEEFGIDCKILSAIKTLESTESEEIPRSPRLESWIGEVTSNLGLNNIHCVGSFKVRKNGFYLDADIINFHVLHSGFSATWQFPR